MKKYIKGNFVKNQSTKNTYIHEHSNWLPTVLKRKSCIGGQRCDVDDDDHIIRIKKYAWNIFACKCILHITANYAL